MENTHSIFGGVYELIGLLGHGTTGTVYEARHLKLNRRLAIKVPALSPNETERNAKTEQFLRECQALADMTSMPGRNIPSLLEVTTCPEGLPYLIREFVDGSTFENRVSKGSIDLMGGLAVIVDVAQMIQRVHGKGYAHRNLSAANVLIDQEGTPWLIGFGKVDLLAGSRLDPTGTTGTFALVDIRGLGRLLRWLFDTLQETVPVDLERSISPNSISTAEEFAEEVADYLGVKPA